MSDDKVRALDEGEIERGIRACRPTPDYPNHDDWRRMIARHFYEVGRARRSAACFARDDVAVPRERGYAHLGIGAYLINHSGAGEVPELVISLATDADKVGRVVGESRINEPGALIHADEMVVRLRFESERGLFALEYQLRCLRELHFPDATKEIAK